MRSMYYYQYNFIAFDVADMQTKFCQSQRVSRPVLIHVLMCNLL